MPAHCGWRGGAGEVLWRRVWRVIWTQTELIKRATMEQPPQGLGQAAQPAHFNRGLFFFLGLLLYPQSGGAAPCVECPPLASRPPPPPPSSLAPAPSHPEAELCGQGSWLRQPWVCDRRLCPLLRPQSMWGEATSPITGQDAAGRARGERISVRLITTKFA